MNNLINKTTTSCILLLVLLCFGCKSQNESEVRANSEVFHVVDEYKAQLDKLNFRKVEFIDQHSLRFVKDAQSMLWITKIYEWPKTNAKGNKGDIIVVVSVIMMETKEVVVETHYNYINSYYWQEKKYSREWVSVFRENL